MSTEKKSLFVTADGKNMFFVFALVSSLFFLWALCNGMIDVMDKHFQDFLHLSKADSACIQFAHYVGYFLMAIPAGVLAKKLGYKGGIIAGLSMVALGCLWFIPATHIAQFWAFLLGVCFIAMGLTFLETVANPYTTVLGHPEFAATRINLAQSFNGVGWILGPILGGVFFYSSAGVEAAHQSLWIPYAWIAGGVAILILIFAMTKLPDLVGDNSLHVDAEGANPKQAYEDDRKVNRLLAYLFMVLNVSVLAGTFGFVFKFLTVNIFDVFHPGTNAVKQAFGEKVISIASQVAAFMHASAESVTKGNAAWIVSGAITVIGTFVAALVLIPAAVKIHNKSIWSHPHFASSTLTQFLYVAAQAGIFSFFINYVVAEIPPVGPGFSNSWFLGGEAGVTARDGTYFVSEQGATKLLAVGFFLFMIGRFSGSAILRKASAHITLGVYALINTLLMVVVMLKLGWISMVAVFLSFFFMSIMFPTIFALGIYGLGSKAKMASSFIVMSITGGAMMPQVMGKVGDDYNMSTAFVVPLVCFAIISMVSFAWPLLSGAGSLSGIDASRGH
jgi:FHS family L-fucose permease-like MFS transporter